MFYILDLLIGAGIVTGAVLGGGALLRQRRLTKALRHTPMQALGSGDIPLVEQAGRSYRIATRSVRMLERILDDDMIACTVPSTTQQEIRKIVKDYYDNFNL